MATRELTMAAADRRTEHYRQVERAVWNRFGLDPAERFVELDAPRVRLRVLEVGTGQPLLFVHGTAGPGAWPSLIRELKGFRCLILDRPGWGLSSALDFSKHQYGAVTANVLQGVLAQLGIDRATVIGNSIGNVWALRLAERYPSLVDHVVLLGGGPLVPDVRIPRFIRLIASPIGAIVVRLPANPGSVRSILRANGHGASVDAGRLDAFIEWRMAMGRDTRAMRHERAMARALMAGQAWRPGLTFEDAELALIQQPTLFVYGTADPTGSVDIWRRVVGLLPHGQLQLVDDGGHEPWIEEPGRVASDIGRFLAGSQSPPYGGAADEPSVEDRDGRGRQRSRRSGNELVLGQAGRDHDVLQRRASLAGGWQDRWDAFRLVTPNWAASLPDQPGRVALPRTIPRSAAKSATSDGRTARLRGPRLPGHRGSRSLEAICLDPAILL